MQQCQHFVLRNTIPAHDGRKEVFLRCQPSVARAFQIITWPLSLFRRALLFLSFSSCRLSFLCYIPFIHLYDNPFSPSVTAVSPIHPVFSPSIYACRWMKTGSATSTTCGSTPCRTCWDTSTLTPSPLNPEAPLTSRCAPTCKCSEAPAQVHNRTKGNCSCATQARS